MGIKYNIVFTMPTDAKKFLKRPEKVHQGENRVAYGVFGEECRCGADMIVFTRKYLAGDRVGEGVLLYDVAG